jgi:tetratricopeptide (TPR) repeat protein
MGRATLARVRGDLPQALQLAQEALTLNEPNCEVHEFIGDVLLTLNRGADALNSFKRARELNPGRVELEDKVARAAVRRAAVVDSMAHMQAVLEGRAPQEPKRNPGLAALASLVVPGLGQLYNQEFGKGLSLIAAFLTFATLSMLSMLRQSVSGGYRITSDYLQLIGGAALWLAPLAGIYIYAIADAAVQARKTDSDRAGII